MKSRKATMKDFRRVKANLAPRMAAEYRTAGWEPEQALEMVFKPLIKAGTADAILSDDNEPIAIIAFDVEDNIIHTSFAAQEVFFRPLGFRHAKRHIREIQSRLGNLPIQSNSYPQDPRTEEWFSRLGYEAIEKATGNIVFELRPAKRLIV